MHFSDATSNELKVRAKQDLFNQTHDNEKAVEQEVAVRRATKDFRGGFMTYNEMHRVYVWVCHQRHVRPDAVMIESLCDGHLRANLDHFDEAELSALFAFLRQAPREHVRSVRFACGEDQRRRRFRQQLSRLNLDEPLVQQERPGVRLCKAISQTLRRAPLVELKLVGMKLKEPALVELANGLRNNDSLRHLSLKRTHIRDAGLKVVAGSIAGCKQLQALCLAHCSLTDNGAIDISRIVKSHAIVRDELRWAKSLRELEAHERGTKEHETTQLKGLLVLDLAHNALGNEAVETLRDALLF
eukprot:g60.t1